MYTVQDLEAQSPPSELPLARLPTKYHVQVVCGFDLIVNVWFVFIVLTLEVLYCS